MATRTDVEPAPAVRETAVHGIGSKHFGSIATCPARAAEVQDGAAGITGDTASGVEGAVGGVGGGGAALIKF